MSSLKKRQWMGRWIRAMLFALLCTAVVAGGAFWIWPLHIQARWQLMGKLFGERYSHEQPPRDSANAASGTSSPTSRVREEYFPPHTLDSANDTEEFWKRWVSGHLESMSEPSIYSRRHEAGIHVYRFFWMRSFHPWISVRVQIGSDGSALLTATHAVQHEEHPPTVTTFSKQLNRSQIDRLVRQWKNTGFWTQPPTMESDAMDGAHWIYEGCRNGQYHVVDRHGSDVEAELKALGINLLETAGFWRGPVY